MGNTIATNQFTQTLEWEADDFALEQLRIAGMEPVNFAKGMHKFAELNPYESELTNILSSHPLTEERIQNALDFVDLEKDEFLLMIAQAQSDETPH